MNTSQNEINTSQPSTVTTKNITVMIGLLLSSLYALGVTFHQGFLRSLNLEETQFLMTLERTFFKGFVSVVTIGTEALGWLFISSAGVVIIAMLASLVTLFIENYDYNRLISLFISKYNIKKYEPKKDDFVEFSLRILFAVGFFFLFYLALLLVMIASDKSGQAYGDKFIKRVENGEVVQKELVLKGEGSSLKAFTIICNASQCAYLIDGKTEIYNNADIKSIKIQPLKDKNS